MSAYLDDETFERWLQSGDLTITEFLEQDRRYVVQGTFHQLFAPGLVRRQQQLQQALVNEFARRQR